MRKSIFRRKDKSVFQFKLYNLVEKHRGFNYFICVASMVKMTISALRIVKKIKQ